jgi:hypothetical protein
MLNLVFDDLAVYYYMYRRYLTIDLRDLKCLLPCSDLIHVDLDIIAYVIEHLSFYPCLEFGLFLFDNSYEMLQNKLSYSTKILKILHEDALDKIFDNGIRELDDSTGL